MKIASAVRTSASAGTSTTAELGDGDDPRHLAELLAPGLPAAVDVERDGGDRDQHDDPPVDLADEHEHALDERDDEGNLEPILAQKAVVAVSPVLDRERAVHTATVPWSAVPGGNGQPGAAGAPEGATGLVGVAAVVEEAVDGRACAADVGPERAQAAQVVGER